MSLTRVWSASGCSCIDETLPIVVVRVPSDHNEGVEAARIDTDGYFADDSVIRRVSRELLLLLGGGRALLMQVAHPLVAAGVAEHSDYREKPWRRLEQTMNAVWSLVFGTRAEADRTSARVRSLHSTVHGRLPAAAGPF